MAMGTEGLLVVRDDGKAGVIVPGEIVDRDLMHKDKDKDRDRKDSSSSKASSSAKAQPGKGKGSSTPATPSTLSAV